MGMYDTIQVGEREGQIKMWNNNLDLFTCGDLAPELDFPESTYSIGMREGGFVHVVDGRIAAWENIPLDSVPCYDKYGRKWDGTNYGGKNDPFAPENLLTPP